MVLIEQYANDRGSGWEVTPWSWNASSFWIFNGNRKLTSFLIFGDAKKSQLSVVCMIQDHFPWLSKNNIFPWHFQNFPWQHKFPDIFQFFLTCRNPDNCSVSNLLPLWQMHQLAKWWGLWLFKCKQCQSLFQLTPDVCTVLTLLSQMSLGKVQCTNDVLATDQLDQMLLLQYSMQTHQYIRHQHCRHFTSWQSFLFMC